MQLKSLVNSLDTTVSSLGVKVFGEKPGLSCFVFHAIKERNDLCPSLYPQENLTIKALENFIITLLDCGYCFISPQEIKNAKLDPRKKYGIITFDDGYFNNTWCTDILKKYQVPAVFFIATDLILRGEKQWSDIIFYERYTRGISQNTIRKEIISLIPERIDKIKDYITREFGHRSFVPQGDQDRPMSEKELRSFAKEHFVVIGNHTHKHEFLKRLSPEEIERELTTSQNILKRITGKKPDFIAYPYGSYSKKVEKVTREMGFSLGTTTVQRKNLIPVESNKLLSLNRFNPISVGDSFNFSSLRSPIQLKTNLIEALQTARRVI
jgi:peptidoglycan/xylan/chitin deacetylase (PgdA/CDA1 family)